MTKTFLYLILLCLGTTVASEVEYIIRPSQSQSCGDRCNITESVDDCLTLSQFINNSVEYLTLSNDTRLIFLPGNYSLESEFIVENIHSFSMFAWPSFSSNTIIVCSHSARFEFRNVSIVTVSGLELVGCIENHVVSVGQFQLKDSSFFGNGQAIVNGTVLTIEESIANLDRAAFISAVEKQQSSTTQELPDNCTAVCIHTIASMDMAIGILLRRSSIRITQSWFEGNNVGFGGVIYGEFDSDIIIFNTTFVNNKAASYRYCNNSYCFIYTSSTVYVNTEPQFINNSAPFAAVYTNLVISHSTFINNSGEVLDARYTNVSIRHSKFVSNNGCIMMYVRDGMIASIDHSKFINNTRVLQAENTSVSISHNEFVFNSGFLIQSNGMITSIDHSMFINNAGQILRAENANKISITHSEFIDNTAISCCLVHLDGVMITVKFNEFINNRLSRSRELVYIPYYTTAENLTNNVFMDNSAAYEVVISRICRPGTSLSLGSPRCIPCSKYWHRNLIGIVIAAFIAGIALVIFMLVLNMTVAVGTLNGILFYADIVSANAVTYFLPLTTPNFVTVFVSWLNLDIGFDTCFYVGNYFFINDGFRIDPSHIYKALIKLTFPTYVIFLVIIVIVASECSSKFAKIIGKGNPVAVLATMILVSYARFLNVILTSFTLLYLRPAYGSRHIDVAKANIVMAVGTTNGITHFKAIIYFLIIISILIFLSCVIYSALVFSWQWLLQYQDKVIFKWVNYQKLRHFLEPYHAPYTANYRYWTGLLLFVRAFLYLISGLNFSLDPRVDLISTIFVVGGLILLKGVTGKRVYKNWLLDVMETAIYFNLVAFSALTWYNLDFGGNQVAAAYTSVMIIFILLLGVIVFHVLRYTRLYKCSLVEKAFKWINTKLIEKKPIQEPPNDAPEELDGFQLERTAAGDQELPTVTFSTVEIRQPTQNQEETAY